jgi:hypothetical protein
MLNREIRDVKWEKGGGEREIGRVGDERLGEWNSRIKLEIPVPPITDYQLPFFS